MMVRDPFSGFGDDTNSSVKFSLVSDRGVIADWAYTPTINEHAIPHSGRVVTQYGGQRALELETGLLFDDPHSFDIFNALQGQQATLRYAYGLTSDAGGTAVAGLGGVLYLTLPETLLFRVAKVRRYRDGHVACSATFKRTVEPSAYYGFALYGEDE